MTYFEIVALLLACGLLLCFVLHSSWNQKLNMPKKKILWHLNESAKEIIKREESWKLQIKNIIVQFQSEN